MERGGLGSGLGVGSGCPGATASMHRCGLSKLSRWQAACRWLELCKAAKRTSKSILMADISLICPGEQ